MEVEDLSDLQRTIATLTLMQWAKIEVMEAVKLASEIDQMTAVRIANKSILDSLTIEFFQHMKVAYSECTHSAQERTEREYLRRW